MKYFTICLLLFHFGCQSASLQGLAEFKQIKTERKPFQKSSVVMKSPVTYLMRETEKGEYDPKPRVVLIDQEKGQYELRWIGYDGKEKIIRYQRHDALKALVEAKVEQTGDKKYVYKYLIRNLPDSPAYLSGFTVQTLALDIRDESLPIANDVYTGHMANYIPDFSEGVWRRFAPIGETMKRVGAGKSIEFSLMSAALPGVVKCKATGGDLVLKGVGEHMPSELENAMPGYDEWATGYTIGPVDKLSRVDKSGRVKYLLDNLTKFEEAGWMAGDTPKIYRAILERGDLAAALEQARKDLEKEFITREVFFIIEGLNS